nr:ADM_HP1_G0022030.mRNA.1.CDS.1 [Saccharomyces cerevisiae]
MCCVSHFNCAFYFPKRLINKRFKYTLQTEDEKNMMGGLSKNKIITPEDVEFKLAQLREFSNTLKERIHNTKSVNSDGHQSKVSHQSLRRLKECSMSPKHHLFLIWKKSQNLSDLIHSSLRKKLITSYQSYKKRVDDDILAKTF